MKKIITVVIVFCLSGCGTIFSKAGDDGRYWGNEYSGVRCSAQMINTSFSNTTALLFLPLALIDMVASTLADTLILPIDLVIKPGTEVVSNPCNLQ